jgi:hypothetical protein
MFSRPAPIARGFLLLAALLISLVNCSAAPSWTGILRDAAGNPVDKAEIHLQATDNSHEYSATTTATGQFTFAALSAGSYKLTATVLGKTWTATETMQIKDGAAILPSLQLSPQSQELRIIDSNGAAKGAAKDETSPQASGGEHLSTGEVSSLPLNERDSTASAGPLRFFQWMGRTRRTRSLAAPPFPISTWMRFRKCNPVSASCRRTSATGPRVSPT